MLRGKSPVEEWNYAIDAFKELYYPSIEWQPQLPFFRHRRVTFEEYLAYQNGLPADIIQDPRLPPFANGFTENYDDNVHPTVRIAAMFGSSSSREQLKMIEELSAIGRKAGEQYRSTRRLEAMVR